MRSKGLQRRGDIGQTGFVQIWLGPGGRMDGRVGGWTGGRTDGRADGQADGQAVGQFPSGSSVTYPNRTCSPSGSSVKYSQRTFFFPPEGL